MQTSLAGYGTLCICQQRCLSGWLVGEDSDTSHKFALHVRLAAARVMNGGSNIM
jgi:hypothetical protein